MQDRPLAGTAAAKLRPIAATTRFRLAQRINSGAGLDITAAIASVPALQFHDRHPPPRNRAALESGPQAYWAWPRVHEPCGPALSGTRQSRQSKHLTQHRRQTRSRGGLKPEAAPNAESNRVEQLLSRTAFAARAHATSSNRKFRPPIQSRQAIVLARRTPATRTAPRHAISEKLVRQMQSCQTTTPATTEPHRA